MKDEIVTSPYVVPLLEFIHQHGLLAGGAFLVLFALQSRGLGALILLPLVIGLGIVLSGAAHLLPR